MNKKAVTDTIVPKINTVVTKISTVVTKETPSDKTLVLRVQEGDVASFELLVIKYQNRIIRLLNRLIRNQQEVEDIAQEVFIKAYRAIGNFRGDSAFYTWIYRIAINTGKNYLETLGKQNFIIKDITVDDDKNNSHEEYVSNLDTPELELMSKQTANIINKVTQSLPNELREALVLREVEGLSYDDIATIMECPVGTVRSRIFRAREAISVKLKPFLESPKGKRW
ncbi:MULTISPECIES: RNA polymerase sigma factor RpoE [Candidatus Ichthyocystis]|uniref:RNA polymerase sigma factor n=1 Tax=Candidatus Ichthyocystis hellenicum TaxID=1561003 RepID=A0A0S4M5S1_9BURK|nr:MULTISPECIES: RNA polymerase sigma factor RpoE [Ichthyocystis]CUT17597.1 RNA polymerase sigma factor RpoE [Candidatus Ichthyocystis hellenicum]